MAYQPTGKNPPNEVHRLKDRGRYDEETIFSILDAGTVGHVTFKLPEEDNDWPVIIPMIYGREDDVVYLHGHMSSRLLCVFIPIRVIRDFTAELM
jgi:nitroimidazol reductase NimA-like FMN-containing flavoprotein (pyridoxamine 5'-phosphate oxidase superfamily)